MAHDAEHDDNGPPTPGAVLGAAIDVIAQTPGAQVFIYVATPAGDMEPVIFASGDDDEAGVLLDGLFAWLRPQFEDPDGDGEEGAVN